MRTRNNKLIAVLTVILVGIIGSVVEAQSSRPYQARDYQVRTLLDRLSSKTVTFRGSLDVWMHDSRIDSTRSEDDARLFSDDLDNSIKRLSDDFAQNQSTASEVQDVLDRAARLDNFLTRRNPDALTTRQWASLRTDLNTLGVYYGVSWRSYTSENSNSPRDNRPIDRPGDYQGEGGRFASRLTGTYELDPTHSDDPQAAATRALQGMPYDDRQQVLNSLTPRLKSPQKIAIEKNGINVTLASSRAARVTFTADGQEQTETTSSGKTIRATATFNGDQLMVSRAGDRNNDFSVTFDSINNGQRLSVTRRISTDTLTEPVIVRSLYNRVSDIAQFDIYNGPVRNDRRTDNGAVAGGEFVVPDNTPIVAVLNTDLRTQTTQNNDHFRMTVRSPREFDGAVIEGYVSGVNRSGRVSGRSGITFNFESIRLRNGRTYKYSGLIERVRTQDGEEVRINNESTVEDRESRGNTTAERAGIGTAVGALIGAIAGGGEGAAIGAVIGAGAGAGSVYVEGRDDLNLLNGTEVTIRSTAPRLR